MKQTSTTFYHAVNNGYDKPKFPAKFCEHADYTCIAGAVKKERAPFWNRYYKITNAPNYADYSVYMDGNISPAIPVHDLHEWVEHQLADADVAICRHAARRCAYVEIEACIGRKKITEEQANRALDILTKHRMPKNYGLWECGIILRRCDAPWVENLQTAWMEGIIESGVVRDQLWLPLALHLMGSKVPAGRFKTIEMNVRENRLFEFRPHT